jgi:hypothetical protein
MQRTPLRVRRYCMFVVLASIVAAVGCGEAVNPASPSPAVADGGAAASAAQASPEHFNPTELTERGWTCFSPPVPDGRIVCSRPNQGFPAIPPPPDRPSTFTFFIFHPDGRLRGTELLIRTDLYRNQTCESTGGPYVFVELIGYYECIHSTGQ